MQDDWIGSSLPHILMGYHILTVLVSFEFAFSIFLLLYVINNCT